MTVLTWVSHPVSALHGTISVPGDKSISHRAVLFGSIAKGVTSVEGFLASYDCLATVNALRHMGVLIEHSDNEHLIIHGVGKYGLKKPNGRINCGNSGTSMRLLAGLLAAQRFDSELTGDESLLNRPMLRISTPLTEMGALITTNNGKAPIRIKGAVQLEAIHYLMPNTSAQVKSCILIAGLYARGETQVTERGCSRNHTELMLEAFSYPIKKRGATLALTNEHELKATHINIPGDISSAAFFIVAATLIPGSDILISKVGINPTRLGVISILQAMGADISFLHQQYYGQEPVCDLRVRYAPLKGTTITPELVSLAIDELPILFIAAAAASGVTHVSGANELRYKESDRINAMITGLRELGIEAQELPEGALIEGGTFSGGVVESQGDHRIAMSFAVAGAVAKKPVYIKDCTQVATSFPNFITHAKQINLAIEELIDNE